VYFLFELLCSFNFLTPFIFQVALNKINKIIKKGRKKENSVFILSISFFLEIINKNEIKNK